MHILIIYQYFGTPKGYWSTRIYELSKIWIKNGHKITVITSPYDKSDISAKKFIEHQKVEDINLVVINTKDDNKKGVLNRAFKSLIFSLVATYYALKIKSDIVLASSGPITVAFPALIKKFFSKIPFVFEMRDLWPAGAIEMGKLRNKYLIKLALSFEKHIYKKADLIVTASNGQSNFIENMISPKVPLTIPNGSDIEFFNKKNSSITLPEWATQKPYFVHTGSMGLIHNCRLIIDASNYLNSSDYKNKFSIVFIGDGAEKEELKNFCKKENISFVYFLDLMPKTELRVWVQHSLATLFTTLNNPVQDTCSPNKIFDSFAAGKAIIQNSNGWIKELVSNEKCGINVTTPEEMGMAMIKMVNNNELITTFNENSAKVGAKYFDRKILGQKYLLEIEKLIK